MKKLVSCLVVVALVLSFGLAYADESRIPKHFQDAYEQATGTRANFSIWMPLVPEQSLLGWSNILAISNFNDFSINVTCWFTTFSEEQTIKLYALDFFEKKIIVLADAGFGDDIYDIFCTCSQLFGATVLLLENGLIVTAWPPIFF